jgi:septation ring formation regulator EzrA|tara:strand:+ start:275 stop:457 length:183 start_codon:yes stop_codon:yes gene_type:complete
MTPEEQIKHMYEVIQEKEEKIKSLIELKIELTDSLNHAYAKLNHLKKEIKELENQIYVGV